MAKERNVWMDILNILAILMVINLHCNPQVESFQGNVNSEFFYGVLIMSLFMWPVQVFYMLTGANLIGYRGGIKSYAKKRILRTLFPYLIWTTIYIVLFKREDSILTIVEHYLNGSGCLFFWFFIPLFSIYITLPFVSNLIANAPEKAIRYFLGISFMVQSVYLLISALFEIEIRFSWFYISSGYLWIPVLGYYLNKFDPYERLKMWLPILFCICVAVNICGYYFYCTYAGVADMRFHQNLLAPNVIIGVCVFLWFKHAPWDKILDKLSLSKEKITFISSCTLGVYLIHALALKSGAVLHIPTRNHFYGFIITYILSLIAVIVLKKMPFLKNIVP